MHPAKVVDLWRDSHICISIRLTRCTVQYQATPELRKIRQSACELDTLWQLAQPYTIILTSVMAGWQTQFHEIRSSLPPTRAQGWFGGFAILAVGVWRLADYGARKTDI